MTVFTAPTDSTTILRKSGGSIQTVLSRTIRLNKESTLEREFITVIDKMLPAELTNCVGVTTIYKPGTDYIAGQYMYAAQCAVQALEDIRAFEIRFLTFNIWGRHVRTLIATEIADVSVGTIRQCNSEWNLFSENEACEHYASIAYLSTIRTATGQVYNADSERVITEAQRFSTKFTDIDLEPTPLSR